MKNCSKNKWANIPLENLFFFEVINKFRKEVFIDLFGWVRFMAKIEFQLRGHPHLHEVDWIPEAPELLKLFKRKKEDFHLSKGDVKKIHRTINRFMDRLNY